MIRAVWHVRDPYSPFGIRQDEVFFASEEAAREAWARALTAGDFEYLNNRSGAIAIYPPHAMIRLDLFEMTDEEVEELEERKRRASDEADG